MKWTSYFLYLTISINVCHGQSNLVPNGSFEDGDAPWNYEAISIAPPWDAFHTTAATNCIFNGEAPPGPCIVDEVSQYGSGHPSTVPDNVFGHQDAHSGKRYAALSAGACGFEVQGIKIPLSEPVTREDVMELKMFVSQADNYQSIGFNVRLSEDGNWSNDDSEDPLIYSGDANNVSDWVEHFREFRLIDLECCSSSDNCCGQYNWMLIKVNPMYSSSGMFLDDVSLKKTFDCYVDHDCVPRSGPSNLLFSMPHNAEFPFCAIGCENLSYIKMEIYSSNGSELIWDFEMEFPPHRICWDGRNANWWPVANATYEYRVHTESFCSCSTDYRDNFLKLSHAPWDPSYEYYNDYYFNMPESGCPRPSFCCGDIDQSLTVFGCDIHGPTDYKVQNVIEVEHAVVKNGADVNMRAGNRIEITEFSTEPNSRFVAEIVPCPSLRLSESGSDTDLSESSEFVSNSTDKSKTDISNSQILIVPNPNNGSFSIVGSDMTSVQILDASGKLIRSLASWATNKMEISGLSPGLYIVRVQMADGRVENAKVIVN